MSPRVACLAGLLASLSACSRLHAPNAAVAPGPGADTTPSARSQRPPTFPDRLAIYAAALRAAAARTFGAGTGVRLLLYPQPFGRKPSAFQDTTALDPALVRALARSGAVEGVCEPEATTGRCANGQRGLAASLGRILPDDSARVTVWVFTGAVTAERDNTLLLGGRTGGLRVALVKRLGRWEAVP